MVIVGHDPAQAPRIVLLNAPVTMHMRSVLVEGMPPMTMLNEHGAQLVELDETDAMLAMFSAGLEPVVLEVKES